MAALASAGVAGTVRTLRRYRAAMQEVVASLRSGSHIALTPVGPVEYASVGEGPAVLIAHGINGGYDQGLLAVRLIQDQPFRLVAVSRPGYLRTPLSVGRTPEEQADAYAHLLDALGIEHTVIVGISGGGPSALQFVLRHPERCHALVMVSAVSMRIAAQLTRRQLLMLNLLSRDFSLWLLGGASRRRLLAGSGITPQDMERLRRDPEKEEIVLRILQPLPMKMRRAGLDNDLEQFARLPVYPVERITAPTLVVHGTDDRIVPFAHAQFVAGKVAGGQLMPVEGGGHFCALIYKEQVLPRLIEFLQRATLSR
jgi:pimeloyl-ACP methyl ester carboxylesterase